MFKDLEARADPKELGPRLDFVVGETRVGEALGEIQCQHEGTDEENEQCEDAEFEEKNEHVCNSTQKLYNGQLA